METVITVKIDDLQMLDQLTFRLARLLELPRVIGLVGDLGAGKTTFVQSLARAFEISDYVVSPSFALEHRYRSKSGTQIVHVDLYRVDSASDASELALDEVIGVRDTLVVVEWANKFPNIFGDSTIWIEFWGSGPNRTVIIRGLAKTEVFQMEKI